MSNLTQRLNRLSKEMAETTPERRKLFKTIKEAYYLASDEGKQKMVDQWDKDGL